MIITKRTLPRRTILRGLGAGVALPLLDAMVPALSGLWIRLRWAHVDVDGDGDTVRDIRVILNYEIPLL